MQYMIVRNQDLLGSCSKNKRQISKFKETENSRYIYQNELDKACFEHDMAYGDFKYLPKRTASDRVLCDKPFNIAKNSKYDGHQYRPTSMIYIFFAKKPTDASTSKETRIDFEKKQLADELHKPY